MFRPLNVIPIRPAECPSCRYLHIALLENGISHTQILKVRKDKNTGAAMILIHKYFFPKWYVNIANTMAHGKATVLFNTRGIVEKL